MSEIKFKEDQDLGKVIKKYELFCTLDDAKTPEDIEFATGFRKLSKLVGFRFTTAADNMAVKEFEIAFVCKPTKRGHNESRWFCYKMISKGRCDVLGKQMLLLNYGFDIHKFFKSDLFEQSIPKLQQMIKSGIDSNSKIIDKNHLKMLEASVEKIEKIKIFENPANYYKLIDYSVTENEINKLSELQEAIKYLKHGLKKLNESLTDDFLSYIQNTFSEKEQDGLSLLVSHFEINKKQSFKDVGKTNSVFTTKIFNEFYCKNADKYNGRPLVFDRNLKKAFAIDDVSFKDGHIVIIANTKNEFGQNIVNAIHEKDEENSIEVNENDFEKSLDEAIKEELDKIY